MMEETTEDCARKSCKNCQDAKELDFDFTMAFQPIINCKTQSVFGYEALVRGLNIESAYSIISRVNDDNRYLFDQQCRIKAIALASELVRLKPSAGGLPLISPVVAVLQANNNRIGNTK